MKILKLEKHVRDLGQILLMFLSIVVAKMEMFFKEIKFIELDFLMVNSIPDSLI